jgi:hypothetical protein
VSGTVAASSRPSEVASQRGPASRLWKPVFAAVLYAVIACLAYWPVGPLDAHHLVGCACSDPMQEVWFLNWTSFALEHGLNPFFTGYMLLPHGANLGANTFMPLLGLIGMPITATLGPVAAYNLLLRIAFAASGFSMYLVLRRYTTWYPGALLGGLLFAFSPFMVVHGQRHLFLVFLPLLPPLIPVIDDWLIRPRRPAVTSGLFLGALVGFEYLISPEVVLATGVMAALTLAVVALKNRAQVRARLKPLLTGGLVAAGLMLLITGYPIWMLLFGPQHPHGPPHPVANLDSFRADVLSSVIPTSVQLFAPHAIENLASIPPLIFENGFYLGLPLLALLVYLIVRCRHDGFVAVAAVMGGIAAILSLGTFLQIGGHKETQLMPFRLFAHIPILQSLEPARFSLFVQLAAVLILARGLDVVWREGWALDPIMRQMSATVRGGSASAAPMPSAQGPSAMPRPLSARTLSVAAVAIVALLPLLPDFPYRSAPIRVPALFTTAAVDVIPQNARVFTYPFDYPPNNDAMAWQMASGMRFRILGGDAFVPLKKGVTNFQTKPPGSWLALRVLLNDGAGPVPPPDRATINAVRFSFQHSHPQVVLVDMGSPNAGAVAKIFQLAIGAAPRTEGGMKIWTNVGPYLVPRTGRTPRRFGSILRGAR